MRKTTKGAIAVGAGVALLLGGAGTLAKWTVTGNVASATTITAGDLTVSPQAGGAWSWANNTPLPVGAKIVPGDTIKYVQTVRLSGTGNTLTAIATFSSPTYAAVPNAFETALAAGTNTTITLGTPVVVAPASTGASATVSGNAVTLTAGTGAATYDVPVTVTVAFPASSTDLTLRNATAALQNAAISFVQQ